MTKESDALQEITSPTSRTDDVLLLLSETRKPIGIRALARRANLAPSTVHRVLTRLENIGLAKRTGKTGWLLGDKLLLLGMSAWQQNNLPSLADPKLFSLEEETGGKVFLGLRMDDSILLCSCAYAHLEALHTSVVGRVFLSSLNADELSDYLTRNKLMGFERDLIVLSRDRLKNFGWLQSETDDPSNDIFLAAPLYLKETKLPQAVLALKFKAGSFIEPASIRAFLDVAKNLTQH